MLQKSSAIDRIINLNPRLSKRWFGLPYIGRRSDGEEFNPVVSEIADAISYYGYGIRDENITTIKDIDLGGGNPIKYKPFPLSINEMVESLINNYQHKYPYTEGDDNLRKKLIEYVEKEGFVNTSPYSYPDIDEKGLCVHNVTFLPSTSIAFHLIVNIISNPGDVVLVTGPNYGLFTIRAERAGAEIEIINLEKKDNFLVNPKKLAAKIDDINESLQKVYHRRRGYVPRVVAFVNANPNNPTGKVMGQKEAKLLEEIGTVCLERGVFVIDDLVYRDICYDKDNIAKPIATIPGMFRNTISLFGLSKSYSLASLRAGFVVADEVIIRELVNRIFQEMDSAPDIVGRALVGAFNASKERQKAYEEYFTPLRKIYVYRYNLLKALVSGIDACKEEFKAQVIEDVKSVLGENEANKVLKGLPYVKFPENLEVESGFFAILDFTEIKGMKYNLKTINSEKDLLDFFYKEARIRFLVGKSISWPYKDELIGRVSFALELNVLIKAFKDMHYALEKLTPKDDYIIRMNELKDQEQMAHIKVDGWKNAYDKIIASNYLNTLNYEQQTKRYISSFDEYKDRVLVAVKDDEVLGYSCFDTNKKDNADSELVSLYIKPSYIGKGIGTRLFKETCKVLLSHKKSSMIVWCLSDNVNAINFYESLGGISIETKSVKIGNSYYSEQAFYFNLKSMNL